MSTVSSPPRPLSVPLRVEHIMIGVRDYDAMLRFYVGLLGFTVVREWTVPELPGRRLAYLALGDFRIELVSGGAGHRLPPPTTFPEAFERHGYGHINFLTLDVDAVVAELAARGLTPFFPVTSFPDVGRRLAFYQDPEGNLLEFCAELQPVA
jgi:catechol 2,3-dioxygenase-like lactoylglutathione lyase family enzyme